MIIQIRGTSGSGKTWVMRQVMEKLEPFDSQFGEGRKKPLYYSNPQDVCVLGHYEATCGGCDNIGSAPDVYDLIQKLEGGTFYGNERKILCEGLLLSEDTKWSSQLQYLKIVYLTTPLTQCLSQIESRRKAAGNEKVLNPENTSNRFKVVERSRLKLSEMGVVCRRCTSQQAPGIILNWLGFTPTGKKIENGSRTDSSIQ